jgi:hypothetical protein
MRGDGQVLSQRQVPARPQAAGDIGHDLARLQEADRLVALHQFARFQRGSGQQLPYLQVLGHDILEQYFQIGSWHAPVLVMVF